MSEPLIVRVIKHYHPDWEPPASPSGKWASCLCPFHGDTNKSASISFESNAFNCFVCDAGGDVIKIIRQQEGGTFAEALRIAERLSVDGDAAKVAKLMDRTQVAAKHFSKQGNGGGSRGGGGGKSQSAPPAAQQAPNGEERFCAHGKMNYRSGTSKAGKAYEGFFCNSGDRNNECKAQFLR